MEVTHVDDVGTANATTLTMIKESLVHGDHANNCCNISEFLLLGNSGPVIVVAEVT